MSETSSPRPRTRMRAYLQLLRPRQWIKNGFVFAPLFFSGYFRQPAAWHETVLAALCFFCLACVVYIVNDLRDAEEDRRHPVKKLRPLAAGTVQIPRVVLMLCFFAAASAYLMILLPHRCALVAALYLALNVLYTLVLKRLAIIDVFFIAFCYVLRVLMGGYAIAVELSPWIILATFLLALFLGFGKRYHEMSFDEYAKTKPNLQHYSRDLLDRLMTISAGAAFMTYAIYTAEVAKHIGKVEMVYTVGFVAFGLFRYLQSVHVYRQGGEPEMIILTDRLQLLNLALWLVVTLGILS